MPLSKVPTLINYKVHTVLHSIGGPKVFNIEFGFEYIGFGSAILKIGIPKHFQVQALQLCLLVRRISACSHVKLTRVLPLPTTTTPQPNSDGCCHYQRRPPHSRIPTHIKLKFNLNYNLILFNQKFENPFPPQKKNSKN